MALSVRPNPGTAQNIMFTVPRKDQVELSVYDLQGRRVGQIARGVLEAGTYTRTWTGAKARTGVYFYRLKVGNEIRTLRAVKLD